MQAIYNIAEICARKNIQNVVLSPGSRCAPLTLAFVSHPEIVTKTISDERSAAFIAIGISQQTGLTTGLVCTSGSAAYNYAPAVAEAYYQQVPLLIITADRPPEWIDQLDGQTIRQNEIFGKHVKRSFTLPVEDDHPDTTWYIERQISEAINCSQEKPYGPVHINIHLREPLYPSQEIIFSKNVKIINRSERYYEMPDSVWNELFDEFHSYENILIVAGQMLPDSNFSSTMEMVIKNFPVVFAADVISNFHQVDGVIKYHDSFLSASKDEKNQLKADLLITFGKSLISKNLKMFLRKFKPFVHWHIQEAGYVADTFQSLNKIIPVEPEYFFEQLNIDKIIGPVDSSYRDRWNNFESTSKELIDSFFIKEWPFNEFSATEKILKAIPSDTILHLSNSMPVRYVNYIGLQKNKSVTIFANRGTSGIDGVMSTAYGAAISTDKLVSVVIGDMAFFYDRNAFWNNYLPTNLRIIVLNNHGGGIFRMIDGPSDQPDFEKYFETIQTLKAESLAKEFDLDYFHIDSFAKLDRYLPDFFALSGKSKILEIETNTKTNKEIFYQFKKITNQNHG